MSRREEILTRIPHVKSIPGTAIKIIRMLQDPDFEMDELIRRIEFDQSMTSNILRMANSAMFGTTNQSSSLKEAVTRLGANNIYRMVVASAVGPVANKQVKGYDLPAGELWVHSVAVGIGVEKLAQELKIRLPEYAFTAAILHDVGKIVLGTYLEIDDEPVKFLLRRKRYSFDVAEEKVIGINHAEAGALLLTEWNIPREIVDVVRWHHDPEKIDGDPVVAEMVHIADALSMMCGLGGGSDGLQYRTSEEIFEKYGLRHKKTEMMISRIMTGLEEARELFDVEINLGGNQDVAECINSR